MARIDSAGPISECLGQLRRGAPAVLPSLLLCDFGHLADEISRLEGAGVEALHLDVMDGHFVPNFTYGMTIVEAVRHSTDLPLDVHLMIADPARYIARFREAGADLLTIHAEAVDDPRPVLDEIRKLGAGAGLALNPPTSLSSIAGSLRHCDLVLVMSVMAGFGGQEFDDVALEKLAALRNEHRFAGLLEVDGGINDETIADCAEAGADLFVVGSGIFGGGDYHARVADLTALAAAGASR